MIPDDGYYIGARMTKFDPTVDNLLIMRLFGS